MNKKVLILSVVVIFSGAASAQSARTAWVDSVFQVLNTNEKIGQLFMVPISASIDADAINEIEGRIKSHEVGGLIFKNIGPIQQVRLINHFQKFSKVPLLIAQEAELSTLLDSTIVFPSPIVLGAINNDTLLYHLGAIMAQQLKLMGVNIVFAPTTKIAPPSANPNPVAHSFGQDKIRVTQKSLALMRGLQDNGVLSCARYFPLKGLTVLDVRNDLPVLEAKADSVQRFPYTTLIAHGLKGITPEAAEFRISYLDSTRTRKTNYSSSTLTTLYTAEWLRKNMDFHGLTFVDIRNVENVDENEKDGEPELFAFQTGNDVLMYPNEIGPAIRKIKRAAKKEDHLEKQLENTVKKILGAKFDAGLWQKQTLSSDNLLSRLNNGRARVLNQKLYEAAITVIKNDHNTLPIQTLDNRSFAYIAGTANEENHTFFQYISKYVPATFYTIEDKTDFSELTKSLRSYQVVIVGIFPETSPETVDRIQQLFEKLKTKPEVIFCDFGHPTFLSKAHQYATVVTAYADQKETYRAVPQVLFGALPATGLLPFAPSSQIPAGTGMSTASLGRLKYSLPEDARMNSRILQQIDSIAVEAIRIGATPGCQIFVARKGKVVFEKTFGHLTYDKTSPVTPETVYDLASVTKVAATLQTAMFLYERGMLDLNKKVSFYLPELKKTNKKDITMMDMLTHQSGLVPFIPMYPQTMKDTTYLPQYYSRIKNEKYPLQVASNLYASPILRDSVWSWILRSKMTDKAARTPYGYKYSDLGFLILQRVAEKLLNQPLDEFVQQNIYEPLGAHTLGFNPLNRFPKQRIAPTEDDKIYRRTFVSGTVHDERAAMLGGVAGHAGLFGNANDLGKFGQMLLQGGSYGGIQYYKPETISYFTGRKYRTSRRGIGWDKPIQSDPNSPTSLFASPKTFGHTGFTGTCMWIDPEFDLVYIFLSNRVYPDRNNKLSNANIRSRIQDVIYKSIFNYVEQERPSYIVNDLAINTAATRPLE